MPSKKLNTDALTREELLLIAQLNHDTVRNLTSISPESPMNNEPIPMGAEPDTHETRPQRAARMRRELLLYRTETLTDAVAVLEQVDCGMSAVCRDATIAVLRGAVAHIRLRHEAGG